MSDWSEFALGDLCSRVTVGHVGKMADEYVEDGVPFLRSQNVRPFVIDTSGMLQISESFHRKLRKSELRAGDVVVVRTGYPGTAAVIPENLDGSNCADLVVITPSDLINGHLLAAIFNSVWGKAAVSSQLVGSAQQHFNVGSAKALRVRLPDRHVQDKIASTLCALNDLIENNRRRVEVLEEMLRAIYREWFVHFRYPCRENTKLVESSLGPIPEGWAVGRVDSHFVLQRGFDLPASARTPGSVPIIGASGVQGFHSTVKVEGPGLTTGRSGTIGVVTYVPDDFWPLNTSLWVKEFRLATPRSAYFLLASLDLTRAASGAAVPTLNRNVVHALPAVCPPRALVEKWDLAAAPIFDSMEVLRRQNQRLGELRDLLLPPLVTGQIVLSSLSFDALIQDSVA